MTMNKNSSEHMVCTYCREEALEGTDPPVCEKHLKLDKKAEEPDTLKELDT